MSDLSLVALAFSQVEDADDYLEAPEACEALAACEVLARLMGRPGYRNAYTEKGDVWVEQHPLTPSPALVDRATSVIDRILAGNSELRDLWDEGDPTEWRQAIEDLRSRLQGQPGGRAKSDEQH